MKEKGTHMPCGASRSSVLPTLRRILRRERRETLTSLPTLGAAVRALDEASRARGAVVLIDFGHRLDRVDRAAGPGTREAAIRAMERRITALAVGLPVFRTGDDSFLVLLPGAAGNDAHALAARLPETLEAPIPVPSGSVVAAAVIVYGALPRTGVSAMDVLRALDRAAWNGEFLMHQRRSGSERRSGSVVVEADLTALLRTDRA